eukprot:gnl/MRDRNA2_/MRDRNA2_131690_c0_seq1.p1 gnl/MRDRNA2_/MRDRNA2_131690_c0~~gnl/MRDRNA2_/MRDRNA2_131690_c0_seq1.p1  ORF type:complete len:313 (+),score=86.46 gnl/MRDRNA2_/MRDRNA2_131690_c0_seq1:104-1042(+)
MKFLMARTVLVNLAFLSYVGLGAPVRGTVSSAVQGHEEQHLKAAAAVNAASDAAANSQVQMFPGNFPPGVKFAAPGPNWLTDATETLLFLPIGVSKELPVTNLKFLCDGKSILVLSTLTPEVEVGRAEKEFKLLLKAMKSETQGDEAKLVNKLTEWYNSEEDAEVKAYVSETLYGLREVQQQKASANKEVVTVPLGVLVQRASKAIATSESSLHPIHNATPSSSRDGKQRASALSLLSQHNGAARIIKESFLVEMPVPHDPRRVFALQRNSEEYFVCYTFNPDNWGLGDDVAHEQLPYKTLKIYDMKGNPLT